MTDPAPPELDPPWIEKARTTLAKCRGEAVLIAVSGGGDSMGLLRIALRLQPELDLRLAVAHLNHGVRGPAADVDAQFVSRAAERFDLPLEIGHWSPERPAHFESDARHARLSWLTETARSRRARFVALGHTSDDQAETILHRIVRGTGTRGLAGIPASRKPAPGVTLFRPLLEVSRREIRAYLHAIGQEFREDATNADLSRTRSRLRHDLLPKLAAEYNPRIVDALLRLGKIARIESRRLQRRLARAWRRSGATAGPDGVTIPRAALVGLPPATRAELLRLAWRLAGWPERGMTADRWLRLAELDAGSPGRFTVGHGIDAWLSDQTIVLAPMRATPACAPPHQQRLSVPGEVAWGPGRVVVVNSDPAAPCDELIDAGAVQPWIGDDGRPFLWVDSPRDGDRFSPLGMHGQSMALNDFFRARRLPKDERPRTGVVRDRLGIIWVVGHRISDRVRRTESTERVIGLRYDVSSDASQLGADLPTPPE